MHNLYATYPPLSSFIHFPRLLHHRSGFKSIRSHHNNYIHQHHHHHHHFISLLSAHFNLYTCFMLRKLSNAKHICRGFIKQRCKPDWKSKFIFRNLLAVLLTSIKNGICRYGYVVCNVCTRSRCEFALFTKRMWFYVRQFPNISCKYTICDFYTIYWMNHLKQTICKVERRNNRK